MNENLGSVHYDISGIVVNNTVFVNCPQVVGLLLESHDTLLEQEPEAANALKTIAKVLDDINQQAKREIDKHHKSNS